MATETKPPEDIRPNIRPDLGLKALEENDESAAGTGQHDDLGVGPEQRRAEAENLERDFNSPSASEQDGKKSLDPGELQSAERAGSSDPEHQIGSGYNDEGSTLVGRVRQTVAGTPTRRRGLIGGGAAGIISIILFVSFAGFLSSAELINLRETALGPGNGLVNRVLQDRRNKDLGTVLKKLSVGDFEGAINDPKMQSALSRYGFNLEFDDSGKLTHFDYTAAGGETRTLNLNADDMGAETSRFFEGDVGTEAKSAVKGALQYDASTWRGKAAVALWQNMKVNFDNWLDRKPSDKATTPEEKLADDLRTAEAENTSTEVTASGEKSTTDLENKDASGNPLPVTDSSSPLGESGPYQQTMLSDPTKSDGSTALGTTVSGADDLAGKVGDALGTSALSSDGTATMESLLSQMATKFPGIATESAAKGISISQWLQTACRVRGTLNFVANTRNVLLSLELAQFAIKFMVAADNQKAGLLSSQGLTLLMQYMTRPNPADGRGYAQSGGIRYLMGDHSAQVSNADISRYSVGRTNDGILGEIASFVNDVPLANNRTACSIVNNGLIQVGGFGLGAVFAVFGGSESGTTEFISATNIGLTLAQSLVFQIGTPLLVKTGAHMVFNGLDENGEMVGDGLASGIGALQGMNAGANGLRPITKARAAVIQKEVNQDQQYAMSKESIVERYFGRDNPNSLLAKMATVFPASISSFVSSIVNYQSSLFSPSGLFGSLARFMLPGSVKAATDNNQCSGDTQLDNNNIATDPFCNPVMADTPNLDVSQTETILKQNQQIDAQDNPVPGSEFANYISDCFSGRTGILYSANPSESGTGSTTDSTCVESGEPYPGDSAGRYDRFATYYGYITDRDNIVQEVNGDFGSASP